MPSASIVVPSRGGRERLPLLFESLRQQSDQDVEMIVVIDGDIDDSESVVARASADLPVRSIVFPENRGRAAALNAGFFDAGGDVLIRADDDLELETDFVEHHLRLHREGSRGVIAMCTDVFPDTPYARAYGIKADVDIRAAAFATPPENAWQWWSGNVSTTRDDFHAVGGYDEDFRAYGWEDVEWGYRLRGLGREILIASDFTTLHHGPVTTTQERAVRAFDSGAARARFVQKHGADALPASGPRNGPWDALVDMTARSITRDRADRWGARLDRTLDRLPVRAAEKSVALLVQAASRQGNRVADQAASQGRL